MKAVTFAVFGLALCGVVVGWVAGAFKNSHAAAEGPVPTPNTSPAGAGSTSLVRGIGYVEPVTEVRRLIFEVEGVVEKCHVEIGSHVSAGEVLMVQRNDEESAALEIAEQELVLAAAERDQLLSGVNPFRIIAAENNAEMLQEKLRYGKIQLERTKKLVERNAASTEELDRAETTVRQTAASLHEAEAEQEHLKNFVRKDDVKVADAKVALAKARVSSARAKREDKFLKAPCDGTILEILRREGEGIRIVDREPALIFADDSRLRVRAEIDERHVSRLKAGQAVVVHGRPLGAARFAGKIAIVKTLMGTKTVFSRSADERKDLDVIQVLIDMSPDFRAPLGLQVDVDIEVGKP